MSVVAAGRWPVRMLAAATAAVLAGCGSAAGTSAAPPTVAARVATSAPAAAAVGFSGLVSASRRKLAPVVAGALLGGGSLSLVTLRGHVVVLNFWASWCGPCQVETPLLEHVAQATAAIGVRVVGVDVADSPAAAMAFRRSRQVTYPSLTDKAGTLLGRFPGVPSAALPSTVLIDPAGRIAGTWVGPVRQGGLEKAVRTLASGG